jgi:hypothetical protein
MPATFPSHQAAVLGLKLWRPQWFDGVALGVGAAAPDVAYLFDGSGLPVWPLSHQWHGLLLWNLPVTLVLASLFRRASPVVAAHLPAGPMFALRDCGALAGVRHPWWVTWSSASLGAASHIVADNVEDLNPYLDPTLSMAGAVVTVLILCRIARQRLIRAWQGPAPSVEPRHGRFWMTAACVAVPGVALIVQLPAAFLVHTTGARLIAVAALALLVAAAVGRRGAAKVRGISVI